MEGATFSVDSNLSPEDQLKGLIQQRASVDQRRIHANAQLEQLSRELGRYNARAMELFGTANIDELKSILAEKQASNTQAVQNFAASIQEAENEVSAVENALKAIQDGTSAA